MRKNTIVKKCLAVLLAILLCSFPVSMHAVNTAGEATIPAEEKISDTLYAEFARLEEESVDSSTEKIPVWVWYKDINQTQVDNVVKTRTQLTEENIAADFEMPSLSLIDDLKNEITGSQTQMEAYLARTEQARALEAQRTDTLIMTRREVSREKYNAKSAEIIEEVNLAEEDIIFKSQYAPAIIIEMTQAQIECVAENENVELIDWFVKFNATPCSVESTKETLNLDKIYAQIGLTGQGVKVGMFEGEVPMNDPELDFSRITIVGNNVTQGDHPRHVAVVMAGETSGIAPNILLYATNDSFENIEALINSGIKVMNVSWGEWAYDYTSLDRWFDHIAVQHSLLLVCSAGNEENKGRVWVRSPAMAFNTLAVGGYDDKNTGSNPVDHQLRPYSSYNHSGPYKPDLVAPTHDYSGATSTAAPIVTGIVALMLELKPSLAYQPQIIKAILLASCQRKVRSHAGVAVDTMTDGITRTQGAGAVDAWNAICIISRGQYGYGEFSGTEEKRSFIQPKYGASNMNVSIAWLRENIITIPNHGSTNGPAGTQHNLDLEVYRNGNLSRSSELTNSSTEMIYMPLSSTSNNYQIRTYKADSANTEKVRYGYAWCTDKMTYKENMDMYYPEGMYYFRNKTSGMYLTVNETNGKVKQAPFTGDKNQQWIVSKTGTNPYTIKTASTAYAGVLTRGANESTVTQAMINGGGTEAVNFGGNGLDNTFSITHKNPVTSQWDSLYLQDPLQSGSQAIWTYMGHPERFQWYFERIGYQQGDVNCDGAVSTQDVLLVQQYMASAIVFSDAQRYLADIDNNGAVSLADVTKIQNMIAAAG